MVNYDALDPSFSGWGWFYTLNELLASSLALIGNFWVYLLIAGAASSLAAESGPAIWPRLALPREPEWFATPLPSLSAIVSIGLGAAILVAPVLLGLLAALSLQELHAGTDGIQRFWLINLASLLRIPAYFLACAVLSLALRRSILLSLLPAAMAVLACISSVLDTENWNFVLRMMWGAHPLGQGLGSGVLFMTALCALACWLLLRVFLAMAEAERAGGLQIIFAVIFLTTMPVAHYFLQSRGAQADAEFWLYATLLVLYASFLPDLQLFFVYLPNWDSEAVISALGLQLNLMDGVMQFLLFWLVSLTFWVWAALRCLDAARGVRCKNISPTPPV
jgi:hypothetical protein